MKTTMLRYNIMIRKEDKYFVAYVPTLGISDFGKTIEDAKKNVQGAIECHIEGLLKTNTEVPTPDTQEFYIAQSEIIVHSNIKFAL